MAMAVDTRQQMSALPYGQMGYQQSPHFTNPWGTSAAASHMYATSMPQGTVASDPSRHPAATAGAVSYPAGTLPALAMPQGYPQRPYGADYPHSATSATSSYATPAATQSGYAAEYPTAAQQQKLAAYPSFQDRRISHPSVASTSFLGDSIEALKYRQGSLVDMGDRLHSASEAERSSFSDALDASRGMVAMSQDITPRNIYDTQRSGRSSTDSYGFPSTHSSHSSISSGSSYPTYYGSSVSEASYGDYSSASESVDMPNRTLPRPSSMIGVGVPPPPAAMMGQFSSKVSSSSQKKHKCKICDKRFTRPSSLQTHMYSHTGEKPFSCDVEGCGRHFSVVSNLRRHKKVHKGEASDHPSPDDD